MTVAEKRQTRELTQRLAQAEGTIQALLSGQIDTMVDSQSNTTLLLAKSQAILRESEERSRLERDRAQLYLDTAEVILLALDLGGRITLVNRYACSVLGWTPEDLLGCDWIQMCLPSRVRPTVRSSFQDLFNGDAAVSQYLIRTKSGEERLIEWRSTLTRDNKGRVLGTLSSGSDITERNRASAEHRQLEQRLSLATAVAKVGVWEWSLADNALNWDATMFEIYGFEATVSLPYAQWEAVVHPADLSERVAALQKVVAEKGQGTAEFRIILEDGSIRHISAVERVVLDKSGNVSSVVGVNVDVTARKQGEAALRAAKEDAEVATTVLAEQAALLDLATDAIFVRDSDDRITFWNTGAAKQYGWTSEQALGKVTHELLQTRFPIPLAEIHTRLSQQGHWEGELVHTCANGSLITMASRWALQRNLNGDPPGVLEINSDITARKEAEEAFLAVAESSRLNELRLLAAAESSMDCLYFCDAVRGEAGEIEDFVFTYLNSNAVSLTTYTRQELIGATMGALFPINWKLGLIQKYAEVVRTGRAFSGEFPIQEETMRTAWLRLQAVKLGDGVAITASNITDRRQQEEALRKSEHFLDRTGRLAGVGGWEVNVATRALTWSAETYRILAASSAYQPMLEEAYDRYVPEDRPVISAAVEKALTDGIGWDLELEVVRFDGRRISVHSVGTVDFIDGRPAHLSGAFQDITARKRADAELRAAKEEAEAAATVLAEQAALLDLATDAIFVRDSNDRITFWNKGATKQYGWTSEQVLGKMTHELLQTRFPIPLAEINTCLSYQGRWEGELVHTCANGSRVTMASRWALQRNLNGDPRGVLEINSDITVRKQAEEALRLSDEQFRLLVQGVKDYAILMLDPEGRITTWNEGAERIKGYRADEIIGQHLSTFYTPEARALGQPASGLKTAAETGRFEEQGIRVRKDGSRFIANSVIAALHDPAGNLRGFAKVTRDVTAQIEAEKARTLSLAAQLRFKGEFLSHVSHELRSPLTAIKQFTNIILSGLAGEISSEQLEFLQIIFKNVLQLQSMIDDLLEVTRLETGKLSVEQQSASVLDIVADVLNTVQGTASAKGVTISCDMPPGLPPIYVDPTRLRQIFIILIDNAVKFTSSGGIVTLRGRLRPDWTDWQE